MGPRPAPRRVFLAAGTITLAIGLSAAVILLREHGAELPPFVEDGAATREMFGSLPPAGTRCADESPAVGAGATTVGVTLFRGPGVPSALIEEQLATLVAAYAPAGVRFVTDGPPRPTALREVTHPLEDVEPEGRPELAIWHELLTPALEHIADFGIPRRHAIHVVFVERIAPPRSIARKLMPHLTGLTLSPDAEGGPPVRALLEGKPFTPTVFLSAEDIAALHPRQPRTTLAHEVGHALGLPHREDVPHHLMFPAPHPCVPSLTPEDRAALTLP